MNEDQIKEHVSQLLLGSGYKLVAEGKTLHFRKQVTVELSGNGVADLDAVSVVCEVIGFEKQTLDAALGGAAAPSGAQSDKVKAIENQYAEALEKFAAQHVDEKVELQGQLEAAFIQIREAKDLIAQLQADLETATAPTEPPSADPEA